MTTEFKSSRRFSRQGSVLNLVLIGLLGAIVLAVGTWLYFGGSSVSELDEPIPTKAFRGLFVKEVLDQGELQSFDNVEVRSNVKSRYGSRGVTVRWVIPEGTKVKAGDKLIELRSDEIKENLENQKIEVANAEEAYNTAVNNWESAKAARDEYLQGVYKESLVAVENEITEATEQLAEAEEYYKFSLKLAAKNFIQSTELRSDESKVNRARRTLNLALKKKEVLEGLTLKKNEIDLESKIAIAENKIAAAQKSWDIEKETLAEVEEQFAAATIYCPEEVKEELQVVYANIFSRRGSSEFVLEEGASVREGQVLIRLPNPNKMEVRATVNESRVTSIDPGMDVVISVDALNGRKFEGVVRKVNPYAEPEGWGGGGVRKYAVYIDVLNPNADIRPGMNTSVLIETDRLPDALQVPIQAVYGYRGKTFCLAKQKGKWVTIEVEVGENNDTNVVIESGLEEGDVVALNPAGFKDLLVLPDLPELEEEPKDRKDGKGKRRGNDREKGDSKGMKSDSSKKSGDVRSNEQEYGDGSKSRDTGKKGRKQSDDRKFQKPNQKKGDSRDSGPNSETAVKPSKAHQNKA